jgi:hypothetical protein
MIDPFTIWIAGLSTGMALMGLFYRSRRDRDSGWRRSGDPGAILPTTPKPDIIPKPQPPPGRIIDASGRTIGYRPLPWVQGSANPPPRNP